MSSTTPITRNYAMDDYEMLEKAQIFHANFVIDLADFTAAFSALDATFASDFQDAIDDADAIPSNSEVMNEIEIITEQIDEKMGECRVAIQKLFTYAKITFKSDAKVKSFGKSLYQKARNNQLRMKELLELGHRIASETANQLALIAAGYSAAEITELDTLMDELDALNLSQETLKLTRLKKTETRVIAYNTVWEYMMQINQASKVVYATSPAKLTEYLLYPTVHHAIPKPQNLTASYDPLTPPNITLSWDAVTGATSYDVYYDIANTGAPSGEYQLLDNFASSPAEIPSIIGKRNYFKIKAIDDEEASPYSDEAFVDVPVG